MASSSKAELRGLYPALSPNSTSELEVGEGHIVYVEQCGNPDGIPIVFLHGGPGAGCNAGHRQFFDPQRFHIILFDQRGCGRSKPFGEVGHNTTPLLLADLEVIRTHCGVQQWALFGGSWGATLALAYAERYPGRVLGLILRGSFLARQSDVGWFYRDGANRFLPKQWQDFVDAVELPPDVEVSEFLHRRVFGDNQETVNRVAAAWEAWSGAVVMFSLDASSSAMATRASKSAIAKARIEMHYALNHYFISDNQLLEESARLPNVPTTIVHGARDLTCPAQSAWLLHQAIPGSILDIVRTAGHLSNERPLIDALVRATDALATTLA